MPLLFSITTMVKRTLCFSNPAYLSLKNGQLEIKLPEIEKSNLPERMKFDSIRSIPIEDIGMVILDNKQISITQAAIEALAENNSALLSCDERHMPQGLMLPLNGNTTQSERYKDQIESTLPLKKQIWQQTIQYKIRNQASVLSRISGVEVGNMLVWANSVKSGDSDNLEGRAAAYYWRNLFPDNPQFVRDREEPGINALLNYGYAILRAVIARSLVASGLLPTLGIHHHNKYNAYCLADDIMEPYRPYVDELVIGVIRKRGINNEIDIETKRDLLGIPVIDTIMDGERRPLMIAAGDTAASLNKCFSGEVRKVKYPSMPI